MPPDAGPVASSRSPASGCGGARRAPERGRVHQRWHRERTTSPSRACTGRAAAPPTGGAGSWPARSSTTPSWIRCRWLAEHEGAEPVWLPRGADGRVGRRTRCAPRSPRRPTRSRGQRHVGEQRGRHGAADRGAGVGRAEAGVPFHTDAVQAVAQLPVDFAASGADALTVTGHKLGGPVGVGALLLGPRRRPRAGAARRRPGARRPLRHPRHPGHPARSRSRSRPVPGSRPTRPNGCARCATT